MKIPKGLVGKAGVLWLGLACAPGFGAVRGGVGVYGHRRGSMPAMEAVAVDATERHGEKTVHRGRPLLIQHGVLTVDGLTVKTGITTRVADLQYMYLCVPGTGAVVLAEHPFSGAREEPSAFQGKTLRFLAGTSLVELTAANRMRGNASVYVRFEPGETPGVRTPALGFGEAAFVPAVWSQNGPGTPAGRRRSKARVRRVLRTAKLCRPSREGQEKCAMIREVVYEH